MKDARGRRHVLLDLDDTLYACAPCDAAGLRAVTEAAAPVLGKSAAELVTIWKTARAAAKGRLDGRGSSHSRLLYIAEMVHALGRPDALVHIRMWERTFWNAYIEAAALRPRVVPFFDALHRAAGKIAIVSDLVLEVQLLKLERFGLLDRLDALVVSEEVKLDKPDQAMFELAIARLGTTADACVFVGDNDAKDGELARRAGIPYFEITTNDVEGRGFDDVLVALGIANHPAVQSETATPGEGAKA